MITLTKEIFKKRYYEKKQSLRDIGKSYSISQTTVRNRMKAWDLKTLNSSQKKKELHSEITYYNSIGYSDSEIGNVLKLDIKHINSVRLRLGLPKNLNGKKTLIGNLTREELQRRINNFETQQSIADLFNTSDVTVGNYMKTWGITPTINTSRRDFNNPNFLKIMQNPQEYKKELVTLTRESFCEKYRLTISQSRELNKILSIPKNRTGYSKWRSIKTKKMSKEQFDLITASMLGDGSFRKLKYGIVYKEFHSFKQMSYLYSKIEILQPFIDKIIPEENGYYLQTVPLKELEDLYDLFYPEGETWKQVPDKIIDNFNIDWLGYWYLDDGSLSDRNPLISNHFLTLDQFEKLKDKLSKSNISIIIKKNLTGFHIRVNSLRCFYEIVNKYVTPDMLYKIEEKYRPKLDKSVHEDNLKKQWGILYGLGFPYPSLSPSRWDIRFKNLINTKSTFKPRENSAGMCNMFYPQMYSHLLPVYCQRERVIKNRIKYADRVTPASLLTGLKLMSKETRTNFSPLMAKIVIDKFSGGKDCNVLDYSMGFGGRLLGLMACKENHNYFGIEPWKANIDSAKKILKAVDKIIPASSSRFKAYNRGSESYISELENTIDIAFSSPPYFDYEKYVNQSNQSIVKFPNYSDWLEGYWRETVKNIKRYLKQDGYFAFNIKNIKKYKLEEDMKKIIEEEGFFLVNTHNYLLTGRMGNFNTQKKEPIFVFKKIKGKV